MTINLKTAVYTAQTYQELLPIARELRAGLSSWGYQYATATFQSPIYEGTIAINAIAEKAMKIRKKMEKEGEKLNEPEKNNVILLCREVSRLYGEDKVNCAQADGLKNICRIVISILFWKNHQSKWSNNGNGFSYKELLQSPLSIQLKTAINKAKNYQELLDIAKKLRAGLYCWGYQCVIAPNSLYKGTVRISAIADKAWKIRHSMQRNEVGFNTYEMENVMLTCGEISRIYEEDIKNCEQANILTTVCRFVMKAIFWMDHQEKWGDPDDPLDLARKTPTDEELLCRTLPGSVYSRPIMLGNR